MAEIALGDEPEFSIEQTTSLGSTMYQDGAYLRPNRDFPLGLSKLYAANPEIYKTVEIDFDRITDGLLSKILRANEGTSRRYISDVVDIDNSGQAERLGALLTRAGESHRGNFFFWRRESTHYHVVHDCTYSGNYCRCVWTRNIDFRN